MRIGISIVLLAALATGQELIPNPEFKDNARGWARRRATPVAGGMRLGAADTPAASFVGLYVDAVVGQELVLTFRAKAAGKSHVLAVNGFAYGTTRGVTLGSKIVRQPLTEGEWTDVAVTYVVPEGTKQLALWILSYNPGSVLLSKASLKVGAKNDKTNMPRPAPRKKKDQLSGPGVIRATAGTTARGPDGQKGVVTFPIPALTEHQVPLTFTVEVKPAAALQGFRWRQRKDGRNWLCEVTVAPGETGATVQWESLVLVGAREDKPLPAAAKPEVPEAAAPWLRSTACVQSADPAIVAKANELAKDTTDISSYVESVLGFTSTNRGDGKTRFRTLDARHALDCGGSCTSRANLCAALLRARGIPARTQAHLPTWCGPLYEHWLVEYWHPGAGWTWIESTLGKLRPQPLTLVVLNVANPADEDLGFHARIRKSGVMIGVPLWSVHDITPPLRWAPKLKRSSLNEAIVVGPLAGSDEAIANAFAAARAHFALLAARARLGEGGSSAASARRIEAAAEARRLDDLVQALLATAK